MTEIRARRGALAKSTGLLIVAVALLGSAAIAADLSGPARVVDGDTIVIGTTHVRLQGLDAEELSMANGPKSRAVMIEIVGASVVTCRPDGTRSYDRIVASCFLPDGTDISRQLIRRGWALDCAHYSHGRYRADEPAGAREKLYQARYC
jgi:micrococcal nuclease